MKLLYDFFPILLFFIAYKLYGIYAATVVAIVASFIQVGGYWLKHRRFENMHLVTLGMIVVLGGANSSNSRRLVEVAEAAGCGGVLISTIDEFDSLSLDEYHAVGLTSGASTPESFLKETLDLFGARGFDNVEERTVVPEDPKPFRLPPLP